VSVDFLVIGSSVNALAAAARLAAAGKRVLVLETRDVVGGPVTTESFAPGFRVDSGVTSAALDPAIARDLSLELDVIRRDSVTALSPTPVTFRAPLELPPSIAHAVDFIRALHGRDPPSMPVPSTAEAATLRELASRLLGLGSREMHDVLRLLFMPARDFVEAYVGSEALRAVLCGAAVRGLSEGPFASGTLYSFLHHCALDDGLFRCTVRGGLGQMSQALADKARSLGVEIRLGVPGPVRVDVEAGVARGARLGDGSRVAAERVVSDSDARTTFTALVSPTELAPEENRAIAAIRYRGSVARVHLALRGLPRFAGVAEEALGGTLVVAPSVAALERAWDEAKRGVPSTRPYLEATLPTHSDPSLAPAGQHVLDVWAQWVPHGRGDAAAVLATVLAELRAFAPELPGLVTGHRVSLPEDLERRFGLYEGQLYGGEVRLEQSFFLRPLPGHSHHRTPIDNLHLGGSAAHPAGYSGRSGWNLAGALLRDGD
jgi:phytoene dehydrogenase-like protein